VEHVLPVPAPDDASRSAPESGAGAAPMVELRGVRRSFPRPGGGRLVALEVEHLAVPRARLWALTGPNGAGKTTLLHLVAGLLRPDRGAVRVDGQRVERLPEAALDRFRASRIGYLLQGGQLLEALSAEENVLAAARFGERWRRASGRALRQEVRVLLERLGVAHRARHLPAALSGGERQRVALARAMVNHPPLLLADEPLAGLDAEATASFALLLRGLVRDEGLTLLVSTHAPERLAPDGALPLCAPLADAGGSP